jgi:hypothetical protein
MSLKQQILKLASELEAESHTINKRIAGRMHVSLPDAVGVAVDDSKKSICDTVAAKLRKMVQ